MSKKRQFLWPRSQCFRVHNVSACNNAHVIKLPLDYTLHYSPYNTFNNHLLREGYALLKCFSFIIICVYIGYSECGNSSTTDVYTRTSCSATVSNNYYTIIGLGLQCLSGHRDQLKLNIPYNLYSARGFAIFKISRKQFSRVP